MNIKTLKILIIPFLLAVMLGGTYLMPQQGGSAGLLHQHGISPQA